MKHRNIITVIVFSIITLGIYDLFWLVSVKKELNARTSVHTPTLWLLFAPLLVLIAMVAVLFVVDANSTPNAGVNIVSILLPIVFVLAFIIITFYWFFKFSKAVGEYTHGEISTALAFLLLWLLRFIGMAVIQDQFNDMLAAGVNPTRPSDTGTPVIAGQGADFTQSVASSWSTQSASPVVPQQPVAPSPVPGGSQQSVQPQSPVPTPPDAPQPSVASDQSPTDPPAGPVVQG